MAPLKSLMRVLWYVDLCFLTLLLFRFFNMRLYERYPALTIYLASELLVSLVGLSYGAGSYAYYWTYFVLSSLLGSVLLIWMSREMFAELYYYHHGLRGATRCTLRRSIFMGGTVTLALAPVAIIHWGEASFLCWQFPLIEIRRCLNFGVVAFVIAMWSMLRWLPLDVPKNVKTYSYSMCMCLACSGVVETIALIAHTPLATRICNIASLAVTLIFYCTLAMLVEKPTKIPLELCFPPIDPEIVARLCSVSDFFERVDEAQRHGYASALNRIPFFAVASSLNISKLRTRIASVILGISGAAANRLRGVLKACARMISIFHPLQKG